MSSELFTLGEGWYLLDVQAHHGIPGELVEGGQLLGLFFASGQERSNCPHA